MNTNDKLADYVLVPRVPTDEMLTAFHGADRYSKPGQSAWAAMLAAAPAPAVGDEENWLQSYRCGCFLGFRAKTDVPRHCPHHMRDRNGQPIKSPPAMPTEQAPDVGGDVAACNCPGGSKPLEAHAPNCPARSQRTPATQGDAFLRGVRFASNVMASYSFAAIREVIHELRTYNPPADPYNGKHIHPGWAARLEAAIAAQAGGE